MTIDEQRAKKGAIVLDVFKPGWQRRIDLDSMTFRNKKCCILGQVYGSWDRGVENVFGGATGVARRAGFSGRSNAELDRLARAWARETRNRVAA